MTQHKNYFHVATSGIYTTIYGAQSAVFSSIQNIFEAFIALASIKSYAGDVRNVHRTIYLSFK